MWRRCGCSSRPWGIRIRSTEIQWLTPYWLAYLVFGALWKIVEPMKVGLIGMALFGMAWAGAIHALAASRGRSISSAVLASLFFFSLSMYWGFAPFVVGFPVFLLWIHLTTQPADQRSEWKLLLGCLLLYFSHALWLVAGLVWLVVHDVAIGLPLKKRRLRRFAAVAPVIGAGSALVRKSRKAPVHIPGRLGSPALAEVESQLAGEHWIRWCQGPDRIRDDGTDPALGRAGADPEPQEPRGRATGCSRSQVSMLLFAALALPNLYHQTTEFAQRWTAPALVLWCWQHRHRESGRRSPESGPLPSPLCS